MVESGFQKKLIDELEMIFPGCLILKNDANYLQGVPDLILLWQDKWAMLECKKTNTSVHQPNQDYYIEKLGEMSYASFIFPENKEEVLDELQQVFRT